MLQQDQLAQLQLPKFLFAGEKAFEKWYFYIFQFDYWKYYVRCNVYINKNKIKINPQKMEHEMNTKQI